jgi:hypothetical protein
MSEPLERTATAVYFMRGRASRGPRRGRSTDVIRRRCMSKTDGYCIAGAGDDGGPKTSLASFAKAGWNR